MANKTALTVWAAPNTGSHNNQAAHFILMAEGLTNLSAPSKPIGCHPLHNNGVPDRPPFL